MIETRYAPHMQLEIDSRNYLVKIAQNLKEVVRAQRLRHEVFFREGLNHRSELLDQDRFDSDSDHLIVVHKETGDVVGNYRLRCSRFTRTFYSKTEFNMGFFLRKNPEIKLELGRACIRKDHRKGAVIQLLWRGLLEYAKRTGAETLFGCSSVSLDDPQAIASTWKYAEAHGHLDLSLGIHPWEEYFIPHGNDSSANIPPLLITYLKTGAKILAPPAIDRTMNCVDFFTLLNLNDKQGKYLRRFSNEKKETNLCQQSL